jgi:hypothetical protein
MRIRGKTGVTLLFIYQADASRVNLALVRDHLPRHLEYGRDEAITTKANQSPNMTDHEHYKRQKNNMD